MNAESIARALGGHRAGSSWLARCPVHDDRRPSLALREDKGRLLVYCHAGCDQAAVIATLRSRGLWDHREGGRGGRGLLIPNRSRADDGVRTGLALELWASARSAAGTLAEAHLGSRGLKLPPTDDLRFHPRLKHASGGEWPSMVALVRDGVTGAPIGIHRTFLRADGQGKAPVVPQRMMLGPCRGGAVHLTDIGQPLMIGEGIETTLSAVQATGHCGWAALSTSGLKSLQLPKAAKDLIVLADGDEPGEAAARSCALRWSREGRRVRIVRAPRGLDLNDVLCRALEQEHRP